MKAITFRAWLLTLAGIGGICAAHASATLYDRLGGKPGVAAIAGTLIDRVVADPLTGPTFKDAKVERVKRLLAEQICELSGGPCRYSGDSMREVHTGLHISQAQFYRMVETLRAVLKERDLDQRSTNQLLQLLAPMKRDIAGRAARPTLGTQPIAAAQSGAPDAR